MTFLFPLLFAASSLSPYVVGPTSSDYMTIQAAINQAVSDGASQDSQINIYVKPGTYNENITLYDGINVMGFDPYYSECPPGNQFVYNGFLSALLTGTITHASGDSKVYALNVKPSANSTAVTLDAEGGLLILSGCRFDLSGSSSVLLSVTDTDTAVLSDTISTVAAGKCFAISEGMSANISIYNSKILSSATSTLDAETDLTLQVSNSSILGSIDASLAASLYFTAYETQHSKTASDPLIIAGDSTTGTILYYDSQLITPSSSAFDIGSTGIVINLINSWCSSGVTEVTGGGRVTKNFITGSSGESVLIKNTTGFGGSDYVVNQAGLTTTNATQSTLASISLNQGESITVLANVIGAQSDHSNASGGTLVLTAKRASGGNIALISSPIVNANSSSGASFTADVDTATQAVRIRVTGEEGTTYNWVATYQYQKVLSSQ